MQVARERAARLGRIGTKKFWEKRKKVLTASQRSDIIQKLSIEGANETLRKMKKNFKKSEKGLDKPIRT